MIVAVGSMPRSLLFTALAVIVPLIAIRRADAGGEIPVVSITGGLGVPGGTVAAVLALGGDAGDSAVATGVDVLYPSDVLDVIAADCTIAERLDDDHTLDAALAAPGRLRLQIEPSLLPADALRDGDLATCFFGIGLGAPAGTAALTLANLEVTDAQGRMLAAEALDGTIVVLIGTPTVTGTVTQTPTPSLTPTVTPSRAPVLTPTETPTPRPTVPFRPTVLNFSSNSCAVVPPVSGGAWWLLGPALLLLARRRDH